MVAKSYQGLEIVSDIYTVNGRTYVKVRLGNGADKQVRWYSNKEYERLYGERAEDHSDDPFYKTQRQVLGFEEGYITIFKGDTYHIKEELKAAGAKFTRFWGWGIPGGKEVPSFEGIESVRLDWSAVGLDDEVLKSEDEVKAAVEKLLYEPSSSTFQGQVGDRIRNLLVKVIANVEIQGYYGTSHIHDFEDEDGNIYSWITAAKDLPVDNVYWLDGTIKGHKTYKGVDKTILTRCKVVEED